MSAFVDAFWRAAAYCLHPRVILWSLLPLVLAVGAVLGLGWMYWESTVAGVRDTLERWELLNAMFQWLESMGATGFRTVLAPMILVALAVPLIVVCSLLLVTWLMTPAMVAMVARRRFSALERRAGAAARWQGLAWSLACTAAALVALVLSIPLWLVPPLVLILPPLIWGWLTYRVMAFDALSDHATPVERRQILHEQRWSLLAAGLLCGYLGAAPSLLWAASAATLVFAPLLIVLSIWLYTLVFAFASLWFAHFTLAELQRLRREAAAAPAAAAAPPLAPLPAPLTPEGLPPP